MSTCYVILKDERHRYFGHQFMSYPPQNEYCIIWNDDFDITSPPSDQAGMPFKVSFDKKYNEKPNYVEVITERVKEISDDRLRRPIGIVKKSEEGDYQQIWLSILDLSESRVVSCHQIDLNQLELKNIFLLRLCPSSEIKECMHKGRNSLVQNFQFFVWFGDLIWRAKIVEFRIYWLEKDDTDAKHPKFDTEVELIGIKDIVGTMREGTETVISRADFYPLYDHNFCVIGTQILYKMKGSGALKILNLENFKDQDFQFSNKYCKFGYKIYN